MSSSNIYDPIAEALGIEPFYMKYDIEQYHKINKRGKKGNFRNGYITPEETKQKLRSIMIQRESNPEYIKLKKEMRAKMSISAKQRSGGFKGKKHSETSKQKMRNAERPPVRQDVKDKISATMKTKNKPIHLIRKGKENNNAKSVMCIQTNKLYDTIKECAEDNNVSLRTVTNWCKSEIKTSNNPNWTGLSFQYVSN